MDPWNLFINLQHPIWLLAPPPFSYYLPHSIPTPLSVFFFVFFFFFLLSAVAFSLRPSRPSDISGDGVRKLLCNNLSYLSLPLWGWIYRNKICSASPRPSSSILRNTSFHVPNKDSHPL